MVLLMKTKKIMAFLKTNVKSPKRSPRSQVWPKKPSCLDRHVSIGGVPTRQPPNSVNPGASRPSRAVFANPEAIISHQAVSVAVHGSPQQLQTPESEDRAPRVTPR